MNDLKNLIENYMNKKCLFITSADTADVANKIIMAYHGKHRVYHNLTHIMHCLEEFSEIKSNLKDPETVEIAIWFHDAVYNRFSIHNEYNSFLFAKKLLGIAEADLLDLILSTKFGKAPCNENEKYLQDIDNSILGTDLITGFYAYDNKIRKEYYMVPDFIFVKRRLKVLSTLLCKEYIYNTDYFREKYEVQAKRNITFAINKYITKL